jgi:CRISPR/Cas system-associated exonuclease Cas4 (RecB family)
VDINDKYGFLGKLDECVVHADGTYSPVDHKTASSDPTTRELIPAYQFQLDSYAFLLQSKRKPPSGRGHLIYFYPADGQELHRGFPMQVTVKTLTTDPDRVRPAIETAINVLEKPLPPASPDCPFCRYVETVKNFS